MGDWISVTDRLPDDCMTVMVYAPDCNEPVWLGYHENNKWYSPDHIRLRVTHWMELPAPAEE